MNTDVAKSARFSPRNFIKHLHLTEWSTLVYAAFTTLLLLVFWSVVEEPWSLLATRVGISAGVFVLLGIYLKYPNRWTYFLRYAYPLVMLSVWYPDTFNFCRHLPNLDHLFAKADFLLFGCEPAYEMSRWLSGQVWSELFNAGYFSYYLMIVLAALVPLIYKKEQLPRTIFVVTTGFFAYYAIYLFLPVAGPQFYFSAIDTSNILAGQFPALGNYFDLHPDAAVCGNSIPGFFQHLVEAAQQGGERPVAAFPSSHVGMSTVLMIIFWKLKRGVFYSMLPLYILLCGATVYIGAHYLIDVFGGWITAIVFYVVFDKLYLKLSPNYEKTIH